MFRRSGEVFKSWGQFAHLVSRALWTLCESVECGVPGPSYQTPEGAQVEPTEVVQASDQVAFGTPPLRGVPSTSMD